MNIDIWDQNSRIFAGNVVCVVLVAENFSDSKGFALDVYLTYSKETRLESWILDQPSAQPIFTKKIPSHIFQTAQNESQNFRRVMVWSPARRHSLHPRMVSAKFAAVYLSLLPLTQDKFIKEHRLQTAWLLKVGKPNSSYGSN